MKRILCYGDSNTWGYDAVNHFRFPADIRWTGVMSRVLGTEFQVIEEGLNARTTVWDDPFEPGKSGKTVMTPVVITSYSIHYTKLYEEISHALTPNRLLRSLVPSMMITRSKVV